MSSSPGSRAPSASEIAPARRVTAIDLAGPRPGARQDQWVELGQDGLGAPVALPVAVLRGQSDGPVLGLTAALHGDELNGIAVLHRLLARLDPERLRGTIAAVLVANPPAYLAGTRRYPDHFDLNHLFPGDPAGKESEQFVHRLLERVIAPAEILIDLHTASLDRVNSYYVRADLQRAESARLAWRQRPQILLHAPAGPTSLRGHVEGLGRPAITLEIGDPRAWQPRLVQAATDGLLANLIGLDMVDPDLPAAVDALERLAATPEPAVCTRSSWIRSERGGLARVYPELAQRLESGHLLAELRDVFGRPVDRLLAPEAGVVIGRAHSPILRSGGRVIHLGVESEPGELPVLETVVAELANAAATAPSDELDDERG